MAAAPQTVWMTHVVRYQYGEIKRTIELTSGTAVWFHNGLPTLPIRWVSVRDPLGKFKMQALLCIDSNAASLQFVEQFIQRWQLEVTQREVREHLGVETQRQQSDWANLRTTPVLFGFFSLITVLAHRLGQRGRLLTRRTAWYAKSRPTFWVALATVRQELWQQLTFHISERNRKIAKLSKPVFKRFVHALCYAD